MKKHHKVLLKSTSIFLNLAWILGWISFAFYLVSSLSPVISSRLVDTKYPFIVALPIHFQVKLPEQDPKLIIDTDSPAQIINIPLADGALSLQTSDLKIQLLATLGVLLTFAIYLFIIFQLKKVVGMIREGKPFMESNLSRIRGIAYAILVYSILDGIYQLISSSIAQTELYMELYMPDVIVQPTLNIVNLNVIGLVLMILVIEHSFRKGLELQYEKDLTI